MEPLVEVTSILHPLPQGLVPLPQGPELCSLPQGPELCSLPRDCLCIILDYARDPILSHYFGIWFRMDLQPFEEIMERVLWTRYRVHTHVPSMFFFYLVCLQDEPLIVNEIIEFTLPNLYHDPWRIRNDSITVMYAEKEDGTPIKHIQIFRSFAPESWKRISSTIGALRSTKVPAAPLEGGAAI